LTDGADPLSRTPAPTAVDVVQSYRTAIRDLVALSTLPAVWTASDRQQILESVADVLLRMLRLEFVHVSLRGGETSEPVIALPAGRRTKVEKDKLGVVLAPYLNPSAQLSGSVLTSPFGSAELRLSFMSIGAGVDGLLIAASSREDFPTETERLLLGVGANQAAIALQRRRSQEALRATDRRFELLNRTAAAVSADLNLDRIVQTITDAGVEMTGAEFGAFFYNVQDQKGEWYTLYSLSGASREAFAAYPMPRNTQIFAPTFNGDGVVRSDDIRADPRYGHNAPYSGMPEGHLPVRSYLAVPVISRSGEVLGGLFFGHARTRVFKEEHEELLMGVAAHASTAIENARLLVAAEREIAERRRAEAELKESQKRLAFLDALGAETAAANDADKILSITTRMLGEHLAVDICAYADMEPDQNAFTIRGDWSAAGIPSIIGTYTLDAFGRLAVTNLHAGTPLVLNDNIAEIGREEAATFLSIGIRATICMPFVKRGALTALMAIHAAQPRTWQAEELALLREVTERSWAHIERVRALAALRELNSTLEQRVADEVAERASAEAQLRQAQKMEAIGQLTGGIAHDFNNMLSVVVGGLQLTKRRLAQGNADVGKYIEGALEGVNRASSLTQRLLAFSRQQPLAPEVIEGNRLVASMTELLSRTLGEMVHVETVLMSGLWRIHADPAQLQSAILNLCVNARDAMPAGGKLTIETANTFIDEAGGRASDLPEGQYVLFAVTDSGEGMTNEIMAKAFDPFFTTKDVGKGSGLGLSQVFGFVRQSGGHIKLYSELGVGTTVKIYLPRYYGEALPVAAKQAVQVEGAVGDETILVVEDEDRVRNFTADALRELGYRVITAANGTEALALLTGGASVTMMLTDIVMPGMNGRELADAALAKWPTLKILFTTGYTRNAIVHNGLLDSGTHLLQKPFGIEQLGAKVRRVLDSN
jgi:GAF domain-containing protein